MGSSLGKFIVWPLAFLRAVKESKIKQDQTFLLFYKLILEASFYHFCCILSVRSESLGLAHTQGERISQGCEDQEVGTMGSPLGGCLPPVNLCVSLPRSEVIGHLL